MGLRRAAAADAEALADVFADAVRSAGPAHYTPAQVEAWASAAADPAAFGRRMLEGDVWIAEDDDGPVGFAALSGERVAALYVRGGRQRRGTGHALLGTALAEAERRGLRRLRSEASAFALPLFLRAGFRAVGTETVRRGGVEIERTVVERDL